MAFTEDHSAFLSTDDFGVICVVGGSSVNVIFDHPYDEVHGVSGETPVVIGDSTDLAAATAGSSLLVNDTLYVVREVHPDGTGMTTLVLEESE